MSLLKPDGEEEKSLRMEEDSTRMNATHGNCSAAVALSVCPSLSSPPLRKSEESGPDPQPPPVEPDQPVRSYEFLPPPPPPLPPCSCGVCGACTGDIDLMPKEAKAILNGPAQKVRAIKLEKQQQLMFVQLDQHIEPITSNQDTTKNPLYNVIELEERKQENREGRSISRGETGWER